MLTLEYHTTSKLFHLAYLLGGWEQTLTYQELVNYAGIHNYPWLIRKADEAIAEPDTNHLIGF